MTTVHCQPAVDTNCKMDDSLFTHAVGNETVHLYEKGCGVELPNSPENASVGVTQHCYILPLQLPNGDDQNSQACFFSTMFATCAQRFHSIKQMSVRMRVHTRTANVCKKVAAFCKGTDKCVDRENVDYSTAAPTTTNDKIEATRFFAFECFPVVTENGPYTNDLGEKITFANWKDLVRTGLSETCAAVPKSRPAATTITTTMTTTTTFLREAGCTSLKFPLDDLNRTANTTGVVSLSGRPRDAASMCESWCTDTSGGMMSVCVTQMKNNTKNCEVYFDGLTRTLDYATLEGMLLVAAVPATSWSRSEYATVYSVCNATTGPGGAQCVPNADRVCYGSAVGTSSASTYVVLHFKSVEMAMFMDTTPGAEREVPVSCPSMQFPGCLAAVYGVVGTKTKPQSVLVGGDGITSSEHFAALLIVRAGVEYSVDMSPCVATRGCYANVGPYDEMDADGGGEEPFAFAMSGMNMSHMLFPPTLPLVNQSTRVSFLRARDYDDSSSIVDTYADYKKLGLPDPRQGMSACATDYFCMPGPCRIIDINYFSDPTVSNSFLENHEFVPPPSRNYRISVDTKNGKMNASVALVGRSQCNPTFGTQKVYYSGEVYDPKNISGGLAHQPSDGSYRYMSTPDVNMSLWPDILSVPSPIAMPQSAGSNPNPSYMFSDETARDLPEGPRIAYRCEDSNVPGGQGLVEAPPVLYIEPIMPSEACVNASRDNTMYTECRTDGMYRATTVYNKTAFTNAAAFWNTVDGCMGACCMGTCYGGGDLDLSLLGKCQRRCGEAGGKTCSTAREGASSCVKMNQHQFGYTYEPFYYWANAKFGKGTTTVKQMTVNFSPMYVSCQAAAGSTPHLMRPGKDYNVNTHVGGSCYKTSTGTSRMPHGMLSTPYGGGTDFAMLTTYPQAAITANESHPGVFSPYPQAVGVVYPPYANGSAAYNYTNASRAAMAVLTRLIVWDESVELPRWRKKSCHVFTGGKAAGAGCSLLPRAVKPVEPGCSDGRPRNADFGNRTSPVRQAMSDHLPPLTRFMQYEMTVESVTTKHDESFWEKIASDVAEFAVVVSTVVLAYLYPPLLYEALAEVGANFLSGYLFHKVNSGDTTTTNYVTVHPGTVLDSFWASMILPASAYSPTGAAVPPPQQTVAGQVQYESKHYGDFGVVMESCKSDICRDPPHCSTVDGKKDCELFDACFAHRDMWASEGPCAKGFVHLNDSKTTPPSALPTGWYAKARQPPGGGWNSFFTVSNPAWRTTASLKMLPGSKLKPSNSGGLYAAMFQEPTTKETQQMGLKDDSQPGPFAAPDVQWWGHNGLRKHPPAFEHLVHGTRLGSSFGFLDFAVGSTGEQGVYECTNAFASWEPASVPVDGMQSAGNVSRAGGSQGGAAPTGAMECLVHTTSEDTKRHDVPSTDFERAFAHSSSTREGMHTTLMLRRRELYEHLTYVDGMQGEGGLGREWWLGGTAVSLRVSRFPQVNSSHELESWNRAKAMVVVMDGVEDGDARNGTGERRRAFGSGEADRGAPAYGDSSTAYSTLYTSARYGHDRKYNTSETVNGQVMSRANQTCLDTLGHFGIDDSGTTLEAQVSAAQWATRLRADSAKRHTHAPNQSRAYCSTGFVTSKADYYERCVLESGKVDVCGVVVTCTNRSQNIVHANVARVQENAVCQRLKNGLASARVEEDARAAGDHVLRVAFIDDTAQGYEDANRTAGAAAAQRDEDAFRRDHCGGTGTQGVCDFFDVSQTSADTGRLGTGAAVFRELEAVYPGVHMSTSNLGYMEFVNQYAVATFYTGWAPATSRAWSAAVQNSEKGAGFACDCNMDSPLYFCERVAVQDVEARGMNEPYLLKELARLDNGEGVSLSTVDVMQCSFGWERTSTETGLYMWSEQKELQVLQTDIFHGHDNGAHTSLAERIVMDGGFNEHLMDRLIFSGYDEQQSDPSVVAHTTYPTTCVRWPYGQVHVNSFTTAGRSKWYPTNFDPMDALMGYCEKYHGRYVHCRRDPMSLIDRASFCEKNPMANYVFMGVVLRTQRTVAQSCSPSGHLCVFVPGYGSATSLGAIVDRVAVGGTVLVAPFNSSALEHLMSTQFYRTIGADPLESSGGRVASKLLREWDRSKASPLGVQPNAAMIALMANVPADMAVADAQRTVDAFWQSLNDPRASFVSPSTNKSVCGKDFVARPAQNGGTSSIVCVKRPKDVGEVALSVVGIVISRANVTLRSALTNGTVVFGGEGTDSDCTRINVEAPGFTLGPAVFDQKPCRAREVHARIGVVVYGAMATGFTAEMIEAHDRDSESGVPLAALGGYRHTEHGAAVINIDGLRATVVADGKHCAAFARAVGEVRVECNSGVPQNMIVVQSVDANRSVDVRMLDGTPMVGVPGYIVVNASDYTNVFGDAEEARLFHRATDVSVSAWVLAVVLVLATCSILMINVCLWMYGGAALEVAARMALNPYMFLTTNDHFKIYVTSGGKCGTKTLVCFKAGSLAGRAEGAYRAASIVLFTDSDCYAEYPDFCKHVRDSL